MAGRYTDTTGRRRKQSNRCSCRCRASHGRQSCYWRVLAAPRWKRRQRLRDVVLDSWYLIVTTVEKRRISRASLLLENVRHRKLVGNTPASKTVNCGRPSNILHPRSNTPWPIARVLYNRATHIMGASYSRSCMSRRIEYQEYRNPYLAEVAERAPCHFAPSQDYFVSSILSYGV
jgi:hypothetical protein